jgi:hypothetical protein
LVRKSKGGGEIMKNFNKGFILKTILIVFAVFLLATCDSSKVEKEVSIQQLIVEGRYEEAKELFKTKTDINENKHMANIKFKFLKTFLFIYSSSFVLI